MRAPRGVYGRPTSHCLLVVRSAYQKARRRRAPLAAFRDEREQRQHAQVATGAQLVGAMQAAIRGLRLASSAQAQDAHGKRWPTGAAILKSALAREYVTVGWPLAR